MNGRRKRRPSYKGCVGQMKTKACFRLALAKSVFAATVFSLVIGLGNAAHAVNVVWQNATTTGVGNFANSGNFDNAFITFPGFEAQYLTSVIPNSPGDAAYFHKHTGTTGTENTMFLDLELNGTWMEVFDASTMDNQRNSTNTLSEIIMNVVFPQSTVTGIRLRSLVAQNQSFHDLDNDTFVFATPIPAALPLFLTALSALGFFGWRRRRAA